MTATTNTPRKLRPLWRLLPFLRPYKKQIFWAFVAMIIAAGTVLALGQGLRVLIDEGFSDTSKTLLDQGLGVLFVAIFFLAVFTYMRFSLVSWIGERVVTDLRQAIFSHVIRLSPAFFESTRTAEVLSRLGTDISLLQTVVGSSVSLALRNTFLFLGGSVMLLVTSPKLTGLVFLVVPLVLGPILYFGHKVRRLSRTSQDRVADLSAAIDEILGAIHTVQAFTREDQERQRFDREAEGAFSAAVRRIRVRALLTAVVILFVFSAVGVVLWIGGHDVLAGHLSAGALSSFIFYAVLVAGAVGAISEVVGDMQRAAGAAERLFELLDTHPIITSPTSPALLPSPARGEVAFQNVVFHYPTRPEVPALRDISFHVKPGETVALVGPSGAGKSTVFQLLLRFYDPQQGHVLVDGVDVRQADLSALRSRIGLVPQSPAVFSTSAWENIRYGRPDATDAEVRQAAVNAHAVEFLDRLPQGLDMFLGEKGLRLSGGQRQRIAIARAILKNPPLLLLDEATSALDAESERVVQEALERLMQNRTTIIIAHRLATVMRANRILVMEAGQIVAQGTHTELLESSPLYARLAALQFQV